MADGLQIQRKKVGNILIISLIGNITEDSQVDDLLLETQPTVILNLEKVSRINSYGIRQWINAMKKLKAQVQALYFYRCPPILVEQFNMISNFGGGGVVYSCYLPFYCEHCDLEQQVVYSLPEGKSPDSPPSLSNHTCSTCQKEMIFNDIEDEYFYFLQHQKGQSVDVSVIQALKSVE